MWTLCIFIFLSLLTIFLFLLSMIGRKTDHDLLSTGMVFLYKNLSYLVLLFSFFPLLLERVCVRACVCWVYCTITYVAQFLFFYHDGFSRIYDFLYSIFFVEPGGDIGSGRDLAREWNGEIGKGKREGKGKMCM